MGDYNSKYSGEQIEGMLDQIASGEIGGIVSETDPIFSASPAVSITEAKKAEWDAKQDKLVSGTNIKTINGESIVGSGDITISGEDGATFTPSVDSAGNLSWSNNKGLTNPPTVNIKGPKGDTVEGAATEEYVNNTIANAITNVINASY